jgi:hypothetical protein
MKSSTTGFASSPARKACCLASCVISRRGLIRAGVAQDPKTPLLVGYVGVTAHIELDVLRLGHEVARQSAGTFLWLRRDEPAVFHGQQRVPDIVDTQPGIE